MKTNIKLHFNVVIKACSLFLMLFILFVSLSVSGQSFTDANDLEEAVKNAAGGETFIVNNGTYHDFEATFEKIATEETPILIKAETVGGVTLTGESHWYRLWKPRMTRGII